MQQITEQATTTQYIIDNSPIEYLAETVIVLCILGIIWYCTGTRSRIGTRKEW